MWAGLPRYIGGAHPALEHFSRRVGAWKPGILLSHVWVLGIKVRHPSPTFPFKIWLRHISHLASVHHAVLTDISMVTQLLETRLPHSLLLVSGSHLFNHHCCILALLQRLLIGACMLQRGTWWEPLWNRRGKLPRKTRVGRWR